MILYGASGHAKVVQDIVESCGGKVSLFVDDNPALPRRLHGIAVAHRFPATGHDDEQTIIAIGDNAARRRISQRLSARFATAIHPAAVVAAGATIGEGTVVMAGAVVQADAQVGRHCIVNTAATIDHDCRIGSFAHISPHATLCGNVSIGEGTWVGAGATVIQGITIGRWCIVGAGSIVTRNIPDATLFVCRPGPEATSRQLPPPPDIPL